MDSNEILPKLIGKLTNRRAAYTIRFAAMLADGTAIGSCTTFSYYRADEFQLTFVLNFNISNSIQLRSRAGHYRIPAQQQAGCVGSNCKQTS